MKLSWQSQPLYSTARHRSQGKYQNFAIRHHANSIKSNSRLIKSMHTLEQLQAKGTDLRRAGL